MDNSPPGPEKAADEVLLFGAKWSAPWRVLVQQLGECGGKVRPVDVDEEPDVADHYRVVVLPTVVKLSAGVETLRLVGAQAADTVAKIAGAQASRKRR